MKFVNFNTYADFTLSILSCSHKDNSFIWSQTTPFERKRFIPGKLISNGFNKGVFL